MQHLCNTRSRNCTTFDRVATVALALGAIAAVAPAASDAQIAPVDLSRITVMDLGIDLRPANNGEFPFGWAVPYAPFSRGHGALAFGSGRIGTTFASRNQRMIHDHGSFFSVTLNPAFDAAEPRVWVLDAWAAR